MYGVIKNPYIRTVILSIVITLCLVLTFPLFIGCSETEDEKASNRFLELLSLMPANTVVYGYLPCFTLIDYASLYQDTGFTFSTPEELLDKLTPGDFSIYVLGSGSHITGYGNRMDRSTIRKEYLGYDATNIDAEIQFGQPPSDGVAAIGRFDPQATIDALSNQDEWPSWMISEYNTEEYRGITIHSWGDGLNINLTTRLCPPHLDELGRARLLAVTDEYLFSGVSTEQIKMIIDAQTGKISSLADVPEYSSIANAMADLKVYGAFIASEYLARPSPEFALNDTLPLLRKFLTFGSGVGQDEKGTYMTLVLYHENTDNTLANADLLKQRLENAKSGITDVFWNTIFSDMQIEAEGNILIAKLYTSSCSLWLEWIYARDNLLFHEE